MRHSSQALSSVRVTRRIFAQRRTNRRSARTESYFLGDCAVDFMLATSGSLAAVNYVSFSTLFWAANQCYGDTIVTNVGTKAKNFGGTLPLASASVSDDAPVALTLWVVQSAIRLHST